MFRHLMVMLPAAIAAAACAAPDFDSGLPEITVAEEPLHAVPVRLPRLISPENDAYGFASATDVAFAGGRLAVLENGNDRIVIFDSTFRAVRHIGSEGAGPGELRGTMTLDARDDRMAVGEINNARVSVFTTNGTFLESFGVEYGGADFALAPDAGLYVNAAAVEHYLYAIDSTGLRRPFGDRPLHYYPEAVQRNTPRSLIGREKVAVDQRGQVYVYDPLAAAILEFDPAGRLVGPHAVPRALRTALIDARRQVLADFGGRGPVYQAPVSDLSVTDDGRLLLLFPPAQDVAAEGAVFGLLIDADAWAARPIRWYPGSEEARRGVGSRAGIVRGDTLFRVLGDEVTVYHLRPAAR